MSRRLDWEEANRREIAIKRGTVSAHEPAEHYEPPPLSAKQVRAFKALRSKPFRKPTKGQIEELKRLGYQHEMPTTQEQAKWAIAECYRAGHTKKGPTKEQLAELEMLGYRGKKPWAYTEAERLIIQARKLNGIGSS